MDFATVKIKINNVEYRQAVELLEDVRMIFSNCHQYNMPTAPEYQAATKLSKYFEKRCKELALDGLFKCTPTSSPSRGGKNKEPAATTSKRTTRGKR